MRGASEWHGVGGPLRVSEQRSPRPLDRRLIAASVDAGIPWTPNYNGSEQDGVSMFQVNQWRGRRFSSADGYLRPVAKRPNLEIRTNVDLLRAEREVVLAAGAIGSPHLLQLSGIGAPEDLRAAGVAVRHALPGVGRNLQDHLFVTALFAVSDEDTLYVAERPRSVAEWLLRRSGPLSLTLAEVVAFHRTRAGLPAADIQFHMGAAYYEDHGAETYDGHAIAIAPVLVAPKARGRVWLRSSDPTAKPRILTNSLSEPEDVASLMAGVKLARRIAEQPVLAEIVTEELSPAGAQPPTPISPADNPGLGSGIELR